ncbi:aldo/keto reductase [Streptomyces sp. NPDC087440]|uniref:aldo/keto reductase n=1 Tax=Streptomyces sp. NPDC087440 TaxID=3365790 RepID=UPI0038200B5B
MRYRLLGRTGLRVSELFLGAMSFGDGGASPDEARRILDLYDDAGGNVVDTANVYRDGQSEAILGDLLHGRRDRFVLASKYTLSRDITDSNAAGNHRKSLTLSLEQSLKRLRTDYLDIYWVHLWDRRTPVDETMRALDDAVRAGKILYVGISDAPAWVVAQANTLAHWRGWTPFAGLQVPYNLLKRDVERELLPMAEAFGMTVAAWSPLAHGILTGRPSDLTPQQHDVVAAVREVADEIGATPAQVALAWTRSRSAAVHPILGARTAEQLADNLGALDATLSGEQTRRLEAAADFTLGFPGDFLAQVHPGAFGAASIGRDRAARS